MSIQECPLFKQQFGAYSSMWSARLGRVRGDTACTLSLLVKAKKRAEKASIKHWEAAQGPVNPAGELIGKHHCRPESEERRAQVWAAIAKVYEMKILEHRVRSAPLSAGAPEWSPSAQW